MTASGVIYGHDVEWEGANEGLLSRELTLEIGSCVISLSIGRKIYLDNQDE